MVVESLREQIAELQAQQRRAQQPFAPTYPPAAPQDPSAAAPLTPEELYRQRYDAEHAVAQPASTDSHTVPAGTSSSAAASASSSDSPHSNLFASFSPAAPSGSHSPSFLSSSDAARELNDYYINATRAQQSQQDQQQGPATTIEVTSPLPALLVQPAAASSSSAAPRIRPTSPPPRRGLLGSLITFFVSRFSQRGYEQALLEAQQRRRQMELQELEERELAEGIVL